MQKHPGGRASTQEYKMKDTDLAGFGRKYQKKSRYSLMRLKHQRIDTDQLDKDNYVTLKRNSYSQTHTDTKTKRAESYFFIVKARMSL